MPSLTLNLLGTPAAQFDGKPFVLSAKPLVLLSLLAFQSLPGTPTTRDELAAWLWSDTGNPLANLSVTLNIFRKVLGAESIASDERTRTLALNLEYSCDALECLTVAHEPNPERWDEVWNAWNGVFLGFPDSSWDLQLAPPFQDWLSEVRGALHEARRHLASRLAGLALEAGRYADAVTYLEHASPEASDPRETQAIQMMLALTALDRPEDAILVHKTLSDALHELDTKPSTDALAAFEMARDQQIAAARAVLAQLFPTKTEGLNVPFVGRESDLEQLERILPRSLEGIGWLTMITGEPGSGKTALARAAMQRLDSRERIYLHCEGFGERNAPAWRGFDLICRNLVRRRRTVFDAMPTELRAVLARFLPDVLEPVTQDPQPGDERLLYAAIRTLLIHDDQPTLLFLDDLQWFDETSLGLVLELLRKPPPRGLLVIATFRDTEPPLTTNTQGIWARLLEVIHRDKRGQELALSALDLNAVEQLSSELQQPANTDWMHAQSGGNPLYLLEMFEANYTQPGRVPPDLEALIRTRIDTLPQLSIAREVLEACAVLGESTSLNEVKNVSGFDYDTTVQALGSLRDARLLQRAEARIQMNHNLTRDATLERMSLERGQVLNLRAARVRQERPELAAMHYWRAMGEGTEKLEGEDMQLAVQAFTNTGTAQAFRGDLEGGLRWFERALELGTDETNQVTTLTQRARIFERLLKYEEAANDLQRATLLFAAVDPVIRVSVLNAQGLLLVSAFGDSDGCERNAHLALKTLDGRLDVRSLAERANALNNLGVAAAQRYDLVVSEKHHRKVLQLRTALGDFSGMAVSNHNIGLVLTSQGMANARLYFEEAITLHERLGNRRGLADVLGDMVWLEWRLGFLDAAETCFQRALDAGSPWGGTFNQHILYNNIGAVRFLQGRYVAAHEAYTTAMSSLYSTNNKYMRAVQHANLAEVELHLSELTEAKNNISAAIYLLSESPNPGLEASVYWYAGELYGFQGKLEEAKAAYTRSVELARSTGRLEREGESSARLARLTGNLSLAHRAHEILKKPCIFASVLVVQGDVHAAVDLIRKTGDLYEEARLAADLRLIDPKFEWSTEATDLFEKVKTFQ